VTRSGGGETFQMISICGE